MDSETHVIKAESITHDQFETNVSIGHAGREWSSTRILVLPAGESETVASGISELLVLPLPGDCAVEVSGETHVLNGHEEMQSAITDYLYIPCGTTFATRSESEGRFALPTAKATRDLSVRYCPVTEMVTTLCGVGSYSRRVNNYVPGNDLETSHLLACEALTPDSNWFSYPPHKYNEHNEVECILEGIHYYEARSGLNGPSGMTLRCIYPSDHNINVCTEVHSRDVVTMSHDYYGPSVAAPGYNLYYLNVMAGSAEDSIWLMINGPAYTWIRDTWASQDIDPRLPMTPLN